MNLAQIKNGKYFFQKTFFFFDFADILFFIAWGGVHKLNDDELDTLYDTKNMIQI